MKVTLDQEDLQVIAQAVTSEVMRALKPLLARQPVEDRLMTVEDLAGYLKVETGWIYKRTQLKELPYVKLGRFCMFRKSEIDAWIGRQGKMPQLNDLSSILITREKG